MNEVIVSKFDVAGKTYTVEIGRMAKQASGACLISVGETAVLVSAASASKPKAFIDGNVFLPLTVDYKERTYAAGKIPGGFFKREGRSHESEILTSRLIDRSIRPMFPEGWDRETQISAMVVSSDGINDTDVISMIGTSIALMISDIPYDTPIGAVRIGKIDGKLVVNPTTEEQKLSSLDLVVAGTMDSLSMVESGAKELSETEMIEALSLAQSEVKKICEFQLSLPRKQKVAVSIPQVNSTLVNDVCEYAKPFMGEIISRKGKSERDEAWGDFKKETIVKFSEKYPESAVYIVGALEDLFYQSARALVLEKNIRADGRKLDEIRPIECLSSILPRAHGSALFTRGQTQALAVVTLGSPGDMQIMDELNGEYKERFMLHYNFPGFATGEPKPERSPGRREIGHGALAKRALYPILPSQDVFPYTIRIVSDILESNGSSSMASVCGGSLALFDAGVNVKASCAGIAMGLVKEGDKYAILSDIMGMEDHLGDMDFKVAGSRNGITALQMDIKIKGLTVEIMAKALEQARQGRIKILDIMDAALGKPKSTMSAYAPKMVTTQISPSKIGALIGPGGKNIRRIQEETGVKIDIEEDGRVFISSTDSAAVDSAKTMVDFLTAEIEIGKIYKGRVTKIMNFGAFVEVLPGKEGLVHISQLDKTPVKNVSDVVSEGDEITVKAIEIDSQGRINLSRKAALLEGHK
ncbi:MAG: polyribonucleotide nucleotidyltransferase [Endomicrobiales bacterium]|nr:polyribonucleotide nucleotidyltransferase [Endomicrobiales bacterium]